MPGVKTEEIETEVLEVERVERFVRKVTIAARDPRPDGRKYKFTVLREADRKKPRVCGRKWWDGLTWVVCTRVLGIEIPKRLFTPMYQRAMAIMNDRRAHKV
jgi:hypothetical protein